jgi:hypothetical protein
LRTSWYASGVLTGSIEGWSSSSSDRRQRTIDIAKALGFATLALAAIVAAGPLAGLATGILGQREIPVWAYSSCCVVLLLAATAGATSGSGPGVSASTAGRDSTFCAGIVVRGDRINLVHGWRSSPDELRRQVSEDLAGPRSLQHDRVPVRRRSRGLARFSLVLSTRSWYS